MKAQDVVTTAGGWHTLKIGDVDEKFHKGNGNKGLQKTIRTMAGYDRGTSGTKEHISLII